MRRFRRILLNALTELSLALAVLVVGLWVRSHWRASRVHGGIGPSRAFVLAAKQGQVLFIPFKALAGGSPWFVRDVPVDSHDASPAGDARAGAGRLGFAVVRDPIYFVMNPVQSTPQGRVIVMGAATTMLRGTGVVVPMWAVFAVLALPVVVRAFAKARSSRRRAANRCPLCDYDLWATPDRCPECGAVPARPPGIQP